MPEELWFDEETFTALRETVNEDVFQRLVTLFLDNTSSKLEEIEALDPEAEPERLAVALHALKGSALMVGAREVETTAEELRAAARRRDATSVTEGIARLRQALARVHDRVKREIDA